MEISFLSHNNVDGQHSRKRCRRHRQPSSGWSLEQSPTEFVADAVVEPNHADVNVDDGKDDCVSF